MSVKKFIKKKNKLVKKATGITLVPEDQIEEMPAVQLYISISDASLCPYCAVYAEQMMCEGCPMLKAGNACGDPNSTYTQVKTALPGAIHNIEGMIKLVEKYNKSNGFTCH